MQTPTSSRIAVAGSIVSVVLVATVASVPGSPFQPILPAGSGPWGPFRWLAGIVGLDAIHGSSLVAASIVASLLATVAFLAILREAWRGTVSPRLVIAMAVAFHVVVFFLPLLFSRDVYSYAYYGRITGVYHANPYVATPSDFPQDALARYVGPRWMGTPAVYGPLFTMASSLVARLVSTVGGLILAFRLTAIAASLATIAVVAGLVHRVRPGREAFAVAAVGLNPVVLFQSVASGHNDLLVALVIAGALALVFSGRDLLATAVLTLGALVKAPAAVPLVLLIVVVVSRREPGRRVRTLLEHAAVVTVVALIFAVPFLQTKDPTLGMVELAHHQGWLAPSRLFARVFDALTGERLGVLARVSFALLLAAALFLVARSLVRRKPSVPPQAIGAAWGWGLLFLALLGPVLLPWYVVWTLPLAWLLPRVPRLTLILTGASLSVSQWVAEPARFSRAYDANVLFGHYVLSPVAVGLLVWLAVDFLRRVRSGTPLEQEHGEVPAAARQE